jgi:hypothetical protein
MSSTGKRMSALIVLAAILFGFFLLMRTDVARNLHIDGSDRGASASHYYTAIIQAQTTQILGGKQSDLAKDAILAQDALRTDIKTGNVTGGPAALHQLDLERAVLLWVASNGDADMLRIVAESTPSQESDHVAAIQKAIDNLADACGPLIDQKATTPADFGPWCHDLLQKVGSDAASALTFYGRGQWPQHGVGGVGFQAAVDQAQAHSIGGTTGTTPLPPRFATLLDRISDADATALVAYLSRDPVTIVAYLNDGALHFCAESQGQTPFCPIGDGERLPTPQPSGQTLGIVATKDTDYNPILRSWNSKTVANPILHIHATNGTFDVVLPSSGSSTYTEAPVQIPAGFAGGATFDVTDGATIEASGYLVAVPGLGYFM